MTSKAEILEYVEQQASSHNNVTAFDSFVDDLACDGADVDACAMQEAEDACIYYYQIDDLFDPDYIDDAADQFGNFKIGSVDDFDEMRRRVAICKVYTELKDHADDAKALALLQLLTDCEPDVYEGIELDDLIECAENVATDMGDQICVQDLVDALEDLKDGSK